MNHEWSGVPHEGSGGGPWGSGQGGKEDQNTVNTIFYFCFYSYFCYCLFLFIRDSLSSHLLSGLLSLSVIFGCFMTFEAFYFSHRFPIVNSAIVEIFKLAIFCTNIV